jgi:hypothetical protein
MRQRQVENELDSPGTVYQRLNRAYQEARLAPEARRDASAPPPAGERPQLDTPGEVFRRLNAIYNSWGKRVGVR